MHAVLGVVRATVCAAIARLEKAGGLNDVAIALDSPGKISLAGTELGEMINGVIRQLNFKDLAFDVVMAGSMFEGGPMLIDPMRKTTLKFAPKARFVRLNVPPVLGATMLGIESAGVQVTKEIRNRMKETIKAIR